MPPSQSAWQQESVDHWRARRPSRLLSRSLQRPGGLCDADDDGGAVVDDDDGGAVVDDDDGHGGGVWDCDGYGALEGEVEWQFWRAAATSLKAFLWVVAKISCNKTLVAHFQN